MNEIAIDFNQALLQEIYSPPSVLDKVLAQTKQQSAGTVELEELRKKIEMLNGHIQYLNEANQALHQENREMWRQLTQDKRKLSVLCPICGDPNCPESQRLRPGYV